MLSLTDTFQNLYTYIISITGVIALIALIIGGILYLTSAGDPEKLSKAKKQILAAFFGIIILLSSYLILRTINPELVSFEMPDLEDIVFHPLDMPPPETKVPTLLGRVEEIAEQIKEIIIPGIELSSQKIKELTDNCDCANTQSMSLCTTKKKVVFKNPAAREVFGMEYFDDKLLEIIKKHLGTPCDTFLCTVFDTEKLHSLATKQIPGTNTFIAQSETEKIEQATKEGKDVFTDEKLKKINKANISILHNDDFIAWKKKGIKESLKKGCISQEKADFLIKNASYVHATTDQDENIIINKDKLEKDIPLGKKLLGEKAPSMAGTFTHEYFHVIDEVTENKYSGSQEYRDFYNRSMYYHKNNDYQPELSDWGPPGLPSAYAGSSRHEHFAELGRVYRKSDGDPNQVSADPNTQQLIKEGFGFLKKEKIVKPDYKKPEEEEKKKTSGITTSSSSGAGTCYGILCYAGPGFQPCSDELEIKENQKRVIAWKDEIMYYRNRAIAEQEDLLDEIKKVLDEQIVYYVKNIIIEDDEKIIEYFEQEKEKITIEKNLKKDLAAKLKELAKLIEQIEPFMSEISALPDECLINVKDKCQASSKGGCHDIKSGCEPAGCSGGNPCPINDIQDQLSEIQQLKPLIIQVCDEIINIIDEIIEHKIIII